MTENKRFKLSYPNGVFLIDGDKPLCHMENDLMIVDLLNELADENMLLKEELAHYKLLLMSLKETAKAFCEVLKSDNRPNKKGFWEDLLKKR